MTVSKIESLSSSAARFCFALCDSSVYDSMAGIRKVALAAANVIAQATNSRAFFFDHFEQHSRDDIKAYTGWAKSNESILITCISYAF